MRALVCGASKGIGRATAICLAERGHNVAILARDPAGLEQTLSLMKGEGHLSIPLDLQELERVTESCQSLVKTWGGLEIVVLNSGGPKSGPLLEASDEEFLQAFRIHVLANQRIVKSVVPFMKEQSYGRIVSILSTSVKAPIPNLGVSNTIRGAVANWMKSLVNELSPHGITLNNVLPGYTETERLQSIIEAGAKRAQTEPEKVRDKFLKMTPAGRFAQPEELAGAIAFLCSPEAGYINGINLPVDGGRLQSL